MSFSPKKKYIGDRCPCGCEGILELHDPGGPEPHQLRCTVNPSNHFVEISADRAASLRLEARRRTEA